MDQFEVQQALKKAQNREQMQLGATAIAFILACVVAYYSPEWLWFQPGGWKNVALFFVIMGLFMGPLWWLIDRDTVDKKP